MARPPDCRTNSFLFKSKVMRHKGRLRSIIFTRFDLSEGAGITDAYIQQSLCETPVVNHNEGSPLSGLTSTYCMQRKMTNTQYLEAPQ